MKILRFLTNGTTPAAGCRALKRTLAATAFLALGLGAQAQPLGEPSPLPIGENPPQTPAYIKILAPLPGAVFTEPARIVFEGKTVDPLGDIRLVEFYANEKFIGKSEFLAKIAVIPGNPIPHRLVWESVPAGEYTVVARAKNTLGKPVESAPLKLSVKAAAVSGETIVKRGSVWRYSNDGTDWKEAWRAANFNDAAWPVGPAQLGYGDGDEATITRTGKPPHPMTAYFRQAFEVADPSAFKTLALRLVRDDGAVVWLNGKEVARANMPDGPIAFETPASVGAGDDENAWHTLKLENALAAGRNVLAVEVHQVNAASSDLSFDLELLGSKELPPLPDRPVVSIEAVVPDTAEPSPETRVRPAAFKLSRTGDASQPLPVVCYFRGTADRGTDYVLEPKLGDLSTILLPAGASSVEVQVIALGDALVEGDETVVAELSGLPFGAPIPDLYIIDPQRGTAKAVIHDSKPPMALPLVSIEVEDAEALELPPFVDAIDPAVFRLKRTGDPSRELVVFVMTGGTAVRGADYEARGLQCPEPVSPLGTDGQPIRLPCEVTFAAGEASKLLVVQPLSDNDVEADETVLFELFPDQHLAPSAYAVDLEHSAAKAVIHDKNPPPPPTASLVINEPATGAQFPPDVPIGIKAVAVDPKGYIPRVEFFDGEKPIGVSEIMFLVAPDPGTPITHQFEWKGAAPGRHLLTARAVDSAGAKIASAPVLILVGEEVKQVVLEVVAGDPKAVEPGAAGVRDTAVFAIKRVAGPLDVEVMVNYSLGGTASNGVDYDKLTGQVLLPAGKTAVEVVVVPLADQQTEGEETVVLKLELPICPLIYPPPPQCYLIGEDGAARAVILDSEVANHPPRVAVVAPRNGSVFAPGDVIEIVAEATDTDGKIAKLEVFADEKLLGTAAAGKLAVKWPDAAAGAHVLVAKAEDDDGKAAVSMPVKILVREVVQLSFVKRDLPPAYSPGVAFTVKLIADPPPRGAAYAIEEQPPAGWSVSEISNDGAYDAANGKVKWGPFTDHQERTLTYMVKPPVDARGRHEFKGLGSLDGKSSPILGDRFIEEVSEFHPADLNPQDHGISVDELTAYAAAWKRGEEWSTGPVPIPHRYVSRAGYLWKAGETYVFSPAKGAPPLCWVPASPKPPTPTLAGSRENRAQRQMPARWFPGSPTRVLVVVHPASGTSAWAAEEFIPKGWSVDSISDGGEFDVASSRIRWGLFLGDGTRTLEYKLTPPKDVADMAVFHGEASFDGYAETIRGNVEALAIQDGKLLRIKGLSRDAEGRIRLTLEGQASQLVAVEVSSNLVDWMQLDPLMLTADEATCEDSQAGGAQRFYRIRPLAK